MPRPQRRSPRLNAYDYAQPGAYFATICTAGRICLFGDVIADRMHLSRAGPLVQAHWTALERRWRGVDVDTFVVMPDHIHGIVWLARAGQAPPLPTLIGSFKSGVSRRLRVAVWQRSFYDRVIRNESELSALRQYVADNPLRWALDRENPANR